MSLIRVGHTNLLSYGHSYFIAAKDELIKYEKDNLINNALANRISGADQNTWQKFIKSSDDKPKKKGKRKMTRAELEGINARLGRIM